MHISKYLMSIMYILIARQLKQECALVNSKFNCYVNIIAIELLMITKKNFIASSFFYFNSHLSLYWLLERNPSARESFRIDGNLHFYTFIPVSEQESNLCWLELEIAYHSPTLLHFFYK